MAALGQLDLASVARPFLVDLAEEINGAVLLLVPQGERATIVDKVDGGRVAVEASATVGRRIPLAAGASGKVFLAYLEDAERTQHRANLTHPTSKTITDPELYVQELERVRRRGYATDDEEYLTGVRATSAPVFDARGRLTAAVLIVGLTGSLLVEDLTRTGDATAHTARDISARARRASSGLTSRDPARALRGARRRRTSAARSRSRGLRRRRRRPCLRRGGGPARGRRSW